MGSIGNAFSVFQNDPQNMPGQGLARVDNYNASTAGAEYDTLLRSIYGNQDYMLQQEQRFNPQWLDVQNSQAQQAQRNALGLYGEALPQLAAYQTRADSLSQQGAAQNWNTNGAALMASYRNINPQAAALYDSLLGQANQQVAMGAQLRPEDVNRVSLGVRQNYAGRGLGNSNAAQLAEAMQLYGAGEDTYQRRMATAQQLGAAQQAFYAPVTGLLTTPSALSGAGMAWNEYAQGLAGRAGATQLNPQAQTATLNNIYGQIQSNNRAQAENETKVGMHQADTWNGYFKMGSGAAMGCWAAREVFGADNPKWLQFRRWMFTDAPERLRTWYLENGERLAAVLKANPEEKGWVREFMESKIRESNLGLT